MNVEKNNNETRYMDWRDKNVVIKLSSDEVFKGTVWIVKTNGIIVKTDKDLVFIPYDKILHITFTEEPNATK